MKNGGEGSSRLSQLQAEKRVNAVSISPWNPTKLRFCLMIGLPSIIRQEQGFPVDPICAGIIETKSVWADFWISPALPITLF